MRAREIIFEYDTSQTVNKWAEGIHAHAEQSNDKYILSKWAPLRRVPDVFGKKVIEYFEEIDPSKKFILPMIRWYLSGSMQRVEDAAKLKEPILLYLKYKNKIKGLNPSAIGFNDFLDAVEPFKSHISNSEADKIEEQNFYDQGNATLLFNDSEYKVVIPNTEDASCYFGKNTRWCTAAKEDNMFHHYARHGSLIVILFKKDNTRWQWCFEFEQFMDEKDQPLDLNAVREFMELPKMKFLKDRCWKAYEASAKNELAYLYLLSPLTIDVVESYLNNNPLVISDVIKVSDRITGVDDIRQWIADFEKAHLTEIQDDMPELADFGRRMTKSEDNLADLLDYGLDVYTVFHMACYGGKFSRTKMNETFDYVGLLIYLAITIRHGSWGQVVTQYNTITDWYPNTSSSLINQALAAYLIFHYDEDFALTLRRVRTISDTLISHSSENEALIQKLMTVTPTELNKMKKDVLANLSPTLAQRVRSKFL